MPLGPNKKKPPANHPLGGHQRITYGAWSTQDRVLDQVRALYTEYAPGHFDSL